jgi:Fe-S-cluster containining protein
MCCDGTLFDGVQLEAGDSVEKLRALGLPVVVYRGHAPVSRFPQPCAALCQDCSCHIYKDRPKQCRTFECGLFKRLKKGEVELPGALRLVKRARGQADKIRRLLKRVGETDLECSLGERYHRVETRLEADQSNPAALAILADASLAMHRLKLLAHEHFYSPADPTASADAAEEKTKPGK